MPLLDPEYILRVLLAFVRCGGLMVAAPFFAQKFIPVQVRVLLAVLLAYLCAPYTAGPLPPGVEQPVGFAVAVVVEGLTGALLGFAAQFVFFAVQVAGEAIGFQMSLSMAQAYDPAAGSAQNPLGRMLGWTLLMVFVLLDGPFHLIKGLALSFSVVPLGGANLAVGSELLLSWTAQFFTLALRLAAPFMVTMLLVDVALGVFARVVPQADLFSISLPAKLLGGLLLFAVVLGHVFPVFPDLIAQLLDDSLDMIEALTV